MTFEKGVRLYEEFLKQKRLKSYESYPMRKFHATQLSHYGGTGEEIADGSKSRKTKKGFPRPVDKMYQGNESVSNKLPLPLEIIDLVFAFLSPLDLHAARSTCRTWWNHIMGNSWILQKSLEHASTQGIKDACYKPGHTSQQDLEWLSRQLDIEVNLKLQSGFNKGTSGPNSMHHRQFELRFIYRPGPPFDAPSPGAELEQERTGFLSVYFWAAGSLIALLVREPISTNLTYGSIDKLLIYHIFESGRPEYVGHIPCRQGRSMIDCIKRYDDSSITLPKGECCLEIKVDDEILHVLYGGRRAFSNSESTLWLELWNPPSTHCSPSHALVSKTLSKRDFDVQEDFSSEPHESARAKVINDLKREWDLLADPIIDADPSISVTYIVARAPIPGNICVLRLDDEPRNRHAPSLTFVTGLRPPRETSIFRNVVATVMRPKRSKLYHTTAQQPLFTIRVAIVWEDEHFSELYVYDIDDPSETLSSHKAPYEYIKGRKLSFLSSNMGGIHTKSPLWDLQPTTQSIKPILKHALGGLHIINEESNNAACVRREILAWGGHRYGFQKTGIITNIELIRYDLMFCEPEDVKWPHTTYANTERQYYDLRCTCTSTLHNYGYTTDVPLASRPDATLQPPPSSFSSAISARFPFRFSSSNNPLGSLLGRAPKSVSHSPLKELSSFPAQPPFRILDSYGREWARQREQEAFKEMIAYFLQHGLTENELLDSWNNATWSAYGQLRLPDAWRDLKGNSKWRQTWDLQRAVGERMARGEKMRARSRGR